MPFSAHPISSCIIVMYLITGDVNTDLLVEVMSPRFLHCEVNYFPFIINKYLGGDTVRLCKYHVSP